MAKAKHSRSTARISVPRNAKVTDHFVRCIRIGLRNFTQDSGFSPARNRRIRTSRSKKTIHPNGDSAQRTASAKSVSTAAVNEALRKSRMNSHTVRIARKTTNSEPETPCAAHQNGSEQPSASAAAADAMRNASKRRRMSRCPLIVTNDNMSNIAP